MKGMRSILAAAALCLALVALVAVPAYAWGGTNSQSACPSQCPNAYPYQYANRYPYPYQYANRYPYPYNYQYPYQYQYRYVAPAPPPPPPPPPPYAYYPPPYPYAPVYVVPGLSTAYGNYTRCQQFGLHQANCFVPDASNSPNLGSIQMEPAIQIWGNCTPDSSTTFATPSNASQSFKCSKTGAGWFPA